MDFCYFDQQIEVFSDEEGVHKAINGYIIGKEMNKTYRDKVVKQKRAEMKA